MTYYALTLKVKAQQKRAAEQMLSMSGPASVMIQRHVDPSFVLDTASFAPSAEEQLEQLVTVQLKNFVSTYS